MRKLILTALLLISSQSFAEARASTNYSYDTQASYQIVEPGVIDVTLSGWTDKPANYIDGNNPDGATYSWPFIIVSNNGICSTDVTGTDDQRYIFDSRYGWIFTSKVAPVECEISHVTPVPERNALYFDFKLDESGATYDNSMKLRITMKPGKEFDPENFFLIARYVDNHGGLGFLDEYRITE